MHGLQNKWNKLGAYVNNLQNQPRMPTIAELDVIAVRKFSRSFTMIGLISKIILYI